MRPTDGEANGCKIAISAGQTALNVEGEQSYLTPYTRIFKFHISKSVFLYTETDKKHVHTPGNVM